MDISIQLSGLRNLKAVNAAPTDAGDFILPPIFRKDTRLKPRRAPNAGCIQLTTAPGLRLDFSTMKLHLNITTLASLRWRKSCSSKKQHPHGMSLERNIHKGEYVSAFRIRI